MKWFLLASGLIVVAFLSALIAPASGQSTPAPEATPEFWPLAFDPATVTVDPDAFTLVFQAPRECAVSPDESSVVLNGIGLYDLATGHPRLAFSAPSHFSSAAPVMLIEGQGIYDLASGEQLLEVTTPDAWLAYDGRFLADGTTLHYLLDPRQIKSWELGDGIRYAQPLVADRWILVPSIVTVDGKTSVTNRIIDTATGEQAAGAFDFLNRLNDSVVAIQQDGTLVAVSGDGVYDALTGEKRFDLGEYLLLRFSDDGTLLMATTETETLFLDAATGAETARLAVGPEARVMQGNLAQALLLSPDNRTLLVPEYTEVVADGETRYLPLNIRLVDVGTGETRAQLPAGSQYAFLNEGRLLFVARQGVFNTDTGALVVAITNQIAFMSSTGRYIMVFDGNLTRLLDSETGALLHEFEGPWSATTEDDRYILISGKGVYDTGTGELVLEAPARGLRGSRSGTLVVVSEPGACAIYRVPQ